MLIYRDLANSSKAIFGHRVVRFEPLPSFSWTEGLLAGCSRWVSGSKLRRETECSAWYNVLIYL